MRVGSNPRRGRPFSGLRAASDFDRVFQGGQRLRSGPIGLVARPCPGVYRIGFKIGRKIGCAVVRNRLRRRFRAILEYWEPIPGRGWELVLLPSPDCSLLGFQELAARMSKLMEKLGFRPRGRGSAESR